MSKFKTNIKEADNMNKKLDLSLLSKAKSYNLEFFNIDQKVNNDFVKELREKLNMSQTFFSKVFGVSKKTIEKWEQGKNPVMGMSARLLYIVDKYPELVNLFYIDSFQSKNNQHFIRIEIPSNEISNKNESSKNYVYGLNQKNSELIIGVA